MTTNIHKYKILILDFGSQYTQLIARRLREIGIYCELHPFDISEQNIKQFQPNGIILSGGPSSVTQTHTPRAPELVFKLGCPVLGICYGMQTMAEQLGGKVIQGKQSEFGHAYLSLHKHSLLFKDIEDQTANDGSALIDVWMSHGDVVTTVPPGFEVIATSNNNEIAAMADENRHFYGLQFHPEVTHTKQGKRMLERFVKEICGCETLWLAGNIIDDAITHIREQVGTEKVLLGLSGGVDSSVLAVMLHRALGEQLECVFVDNGLLRLDEKNQVKNLFDKHFGMRVHYIDAEQEFLSELKGVVDPEQKRKIIGRVFIEVFERKAKKLIDIKWLAQGTIYPDVIESAASKSGKAVVIKSHHNVGGLPERMSLKLLEPLRELFKDEVRNVGLELGLPSEIVFRHPFPGPGLGVRVLGEVKSEYLKKLRLADHIFMEELKYSGWYQKVSQAFAVYIPQKSVAVMGDGRVYDDIIAIRAVETIDFMTAHWAHLPYELLGKISNRIMNEVKGISRVVYDISGKPPATIEWE